MFTMKLGRRALMLVALAILAFSLAACVTVETPVPPTKTALTADTPTPIIIVVTATPAPPTSTSTAVPPAPTATSTAVPPTATVIKSPTIPPVKTVVVVPSPTPQCQQLPISGFGKVWSENAVVRDYVGCAAMPEKGVNFTAQRFEQGVIFYTEPTGYFNQDSVLILFRDNKTWSEVLVPQDGKPGAITGVPAGKFAPQGRIGYAWQNGASVRTRLGWAVAPEKSGTVAASTHAAFQPFTRGYMFWIPWDAAANDLYIYALASFKPYPPGGNRFDWVEYKDTWTP